MSSGSECGTVARPPRTARLTSRDAARRDHRDRRDRRHLIDTLRLTRTLNNRNNKHKPYKRYVEIKNNKGLLVTDFQRVIIVIFLLFE